MKRFVTAVVAGLVMFALTVGAADRENFSVGTLTVGKILSVDEGADGANLLAAPSKTVVFMDDFFNLCVATNVTESTVRLAPWKYTGDAGAATDFAITATLNGWATLLTGGTSNNEAYVQLGASGTCGSFGFTSNSSKRLVFEANVKGPAVSANTANCATFVGLAEAGSSAANFIVDSTSVVDTNKSFIGFRAAAGASTSIWSFVANKADASTNQVITNILVTSSTVAHRLGFVYDGQNEITVYVDGVAKGSRTITDVLYPTTTPLNPIIGSKTYTTSYTPTQQVDYIYVNQGR